jgi:DNA-binding MarR family transcriptional regulator
MRDAILPNTKGWVVAILRALYFSPNHHMSHVEISNATRVTAANLTYQVDALEKEGFVARFPHPTNRRVTLIELTPKGETICQKLVPAFGRFVSELGQTFSSDEKAKFFEFLARFQESAEAFKRTH